MTELVTNYHRASIYDGSGVTEVAVVCTECRHMQILIVSNSPDGWRLVHWTCENCDCQLRARVKVNVCNYKCKKVTNWGNR